MEEGWYIDKTDNTLCKIEGFETMFGTTLVCYRREMKTVTNLTDLVDITDDYDPLVEDYEWICQQRERSIDFRNFCLERELYMMLHYMQYINQEPIFN